MIAGIASQQQIAFSFEGQTYVVVRTDWAGPKRPTFDLYEAWVGQGRLLRGVRAHLVDHKKDSVLPPVKKTRSYLSEQVLCFSLHSCAYTLRIVERSGGAADKVELFFIRTELNREKVALKMERRHHFRRVKLPESP